MKKMMAICLLFISSLAAEAQERKVTLSGYVRNASNGEELIGASVYIQSLATGAVTNVYGFYSLSVPIGNYKVTYSYVGFESKEIALQISDNTNYNVELEETSTSLEAVEITGEKQNQNVTSTEMSTLKVEMEEIKKLPALLGEVDVIKSIQLLPGVTTVGEGASGFNVRGGSIDQNLILLDEAPVYNSSHLLGFFSVFNPDAVKNVKLVKGGIPAEYGGRLSSLLDVRMKEGNMKQTEVSGGIGLIFSRLTVETPIIKNKSSIILAGRRSYIDVLARPFLNKDLKDLQFYFYDFTAKANYILNDNNRFFVSGYFGRDVFGAGLGIGFDWGNKTTSFRWNHIFNNKLFLNTTAYYSDYDYALNFGDTGGKEGFRWNSSIINYSVKPEFTYFANSNNTIRFGFQSIFYDFKPGHANFTSDGQSKSIGLDDKYSLESAAYVSNEQKLGYRITMSYGLRYSLYQYMGKGKAYILGQPAAPGLRKPVTDVVSYSNGEVIQTYGNLEPRFAINYKLNEMSSIKASYNRMAQYIHLISNTTASTPLDVWQPATNNLKPQIADQVALGYFRNLKDNMFETSLEVYYKDMQNQVDYINNANLLLNEYLEADLLTGHGRAYGLELYIKKRTGKITGWISYTLGKTERQVLGINRDNWFPSRFDKRHNLSVVVMYPINDRWTFSANFTFSTGTPATFPTNRILIGDWVIPHNSYQSRNNYRIPPYNRLDLSVTRGMPKASTKRLQSELVIGVYNAYNRRNPFSVYFQQDPNAPGVTQALKYSIIAGVVPAVSWNFNFK
ncbi:TonB-dependent receptor plug domain-containing protein [bacterium]|nr:TonB-dependent receptor plug domain-containing protein [bacterium]